MPGQFLRRIISGIGRAAGERLVYRRRDGTCERRVRLAEPWPVLALLLTVGLAVVFPARVWPALAAGLAAVLVSCLVWAVACARWAELDRELRHSWVQVGDRLEEQFTLNNRAALPILAAEILDHSDLPGYDGSTVRAVGGIGVEKWRQKSVSRQRGVFHLGPTTLRFGDPLGIFEVTCYYPDQREILVFPPVIHDLTVPVPTGGGQGAIASRQRRLVETPATGGVRDYRPGDPIRRIHWPLSLRHDTLLIKEFDEEKGGDVLLALDLDPEVHAGHGAESTLEYAIIWTASWAWHLLRQGKGVGLYTRAPEPVLVPPRRGTAHLWHILRALAPLETRADLPLRAMLREVRPLAARGRSLIVITPSAAPDWPVELMTPGLRAAAKGVILLDADAFRLVGGEAAQTGAALAGLRTQLAGMGLPVTLVAPRAGLTARPVAPGTGDLEYVATPWGRVIARPAAAEVQT